MHCHNGQTEIWVGRRAATFFSRIIPFTFLLFEAGHLMLWPDEKHAHTCVRARTQARTQATAPPPFQGSGMI